MSANKSNNLKVRTIHMGVEFDEEDKEYRWETGYDNCWEAISEDQDGLLDVGKMRKAKRAREEERTLPHRLGMMRHLYVILDCTENMLECDLAPTRLECSVKFLKMFVTEFLDQNPISQMGLIKIVGGLAEQMTELTSTEKLHQAALDKVKRSDVADTLSLQNGLDMAYSDLKLVPSHSTREILVIMGSLSIMDPGQCDSGYPLNEIIEEFVREGVRVSFISLSAEVRICSNMARLTKGTFGAALDEQHYKHLLMAHVRPPIVALTQPNALIKMGFPNPNSYEDYYPPLALCSCHLHSQTEGSRLSCARYMCPNCQCKYCELPAECRTCGTLLMSANRLARSYRHLFPIPPFKELPYLSQAALCFSCHKHFNNNVKQIYLCGICGQHFCTDCDVLIHEIIHSCPGCAIKPLPVA